MGLALFLISYLLGGLTFIPLLVVAFVYLHPIITDESRGKAEFDGGSLDYATSLKAGEIEENAQSGLETYKAGWVFVTQDYLDSPDEITSATQSISESSENRSAYSSLYKLVQKETILKEGIAKKTRSSSFDFLSGTNGNTATTTGANGSGSTITGNNANGTTGTNGTSAGNDPNSTTIGGSSDTISNTDHTDSNPPQPQSSQASQTIRTSQRKHRFYAILKHGNLFLYKDESLKDVQHVIVLSSHFVSIWPRNLSDAQLFTRSSAIAIINSSKVASLSSSTVPKGSFFIYCDFNIDKEDWYFALIRATKFSTNTDLQAGLNPDTHAKTLHFTTSDMIDLIQTLYSSEGQLQTKWLNAFIGRLFLAFQRTKVLEQYLYTKVAKKLNKIKTPGFLDKFVIKNIYPGDSAPFFTYPNLKEISPDGTILVSTYLTYHGNFSIEIATKVNISLGSRFKSRDVDLVLRITLSKLEGPMVFKIKPPPSERVWYAFEIEPSMNLKIEPVISSRQMAYTIITKSIEKKFKEAVKESFVLPHWDDIVFYDTADEVYRGGIWDPSARYPDTSDQNSVVSTHPSESSEVDPDLNAELDEKAELHPSKTKNKLSTTLTDFSNKLKNTRSSNSLNSSTPFFSEDSPAVPPKNSATMKTLKRIGKWYFKDENPAAEETYTPPEMISSRRGPRKNSNASSIEKPSSPSKANPSYEFGRYSHNHSASLYSNGSSEGKSVSRKTSTGALDKAFVPPLPPKDDDATFVDEEVRSVSPELPTATDDDILFDDLNDKLHNFAHESSIPIVNKSPTSSVSGITVGTTNNKLTRKPPPPSPPLNQGEFPAETQDETHSP